MNRSTMNSVLGFDIYAQDRDSMLYSKAPKVGYNANGTLSHYEFTYTNILESLDTRELILNYGKNLIIRNMELLQIQLLILIMILVSM